jgi:exopolyphosphatase/guanosine-5'-triphosphate,3'-diphosphate pyrophosphatase
VLISPSAHHKHGHYIVSTVSLPGFLPEENAVMAALAHFHRKALPRPGHPVLAALPPEQQAFVQDILPVLRLADALDRSHGSLVTGVRVTAGRKGAAEVTALATAPIPYEEWAIARMLEAAPSLFGHPIRFHVRVGE